MARVRGRVTSCTTRSISSVVTPGPARVRLRLRSVVTPGPVRVRLGLRLTVRITHGWRTDDAVVRVRVRVKVGVGVGVRLGVGVRRVAYG